MAFKQPRIPEYRESEGTGKYLKSLVLFLKDFCMESWKATMNLQKRVEGGGEETPEGLALSPDDAQRETVKPQQPIIDRADNLHVYPLTTYDQVIMPDGSRWDGEAGKAYALVHIRVETSNDMEIAPVITITNTDDGDVYMEFEYAGETTVQIPAGMRYRISASEIFAYSHPESTEHHAAAGTEKNIVLFYQYGRRYGFRRAKAEADPYARIEYLYDAVGMAPMSVDSETGEVDYGGWKDFIDELCRPVMLKYDGTVDYELDHDDQTKKLDGTDSDVANTAYEGNAMVEFRKFKWVHRSEDSSYEYVIFSDQNFWTEETYSAYAHTNEAGNINDAFYLGMYRGVTVGSKSRSIQPSGDLVFMASATAGFTYAQANGTGWNMYYKSAWDYVNDILTMLGKNDNEVSSFVEPANVAKFLYLSGIWYGHTLLAGLLYKSGKFYTKMTPPYDTSGTNYTNTGVAGSGTQGGYVSANSTTDGYGYLPKAASGSETTYMGGDQFWWGTSSSTTYFASVSTRAGARTIMITSGSTISFSHNRITYLAP